MARAKYEFKQRKNIPIKNKKQSKKVKPQEIKSNQKKFVKFDTESMQSQVKAASGNQGKKSFGVKRKQQDVDNGVKKFKNNRDQAILRVHNSNNNIQKEVKDSPLKPIKSSGSLKQDNLKIQSLDAKKSVVKMGKVETSEQNTDIKKMDIKSSHCSESIEEIPSAQQAMGCRKRKNEILKQQKLENTKQESTRPNPSKQKKEEERTVEKMANSKDNFTQLDNAEEIPVVQKVRSRRRRKQKNMSKNNLQEAVSPIVAQLSTVKNGFSNNKNSSEEVENMKPTQPQPKLKVQKAKNVKEIVVDPISDTYLIGSLKVKQGGIHKKDKLDDCMENLKKQNLNIVQEPIHQKTNSLKKKSDTSLDANRKQNEQFNCEKISKENRDMENSKRSKPQNLAQEPIKSVAIEKSQSGLFPKISPVKQVQIGKQDKKTNFEKKSKEKQVNFSEKFKSISQNQMVNNVGQKKTEENKQNILKEIQDNLEKKSRGSSPESIAQKSIKEKDSERPQSGLKKKKKHDKCEKISKGSKPENKALNPIKRKKAEASQTGLIEEIVPVKQVLFEKQNQDSCEKNSEDKRVNFSEELKSISQKQIQQEEDKQNILKEVQDNFEKKSRGFEPETIAQNSIKEKDTDRSQSGLKKKKKHDKCEKISKPESKALKPIKRKTAEASQTGLIEEVVPVKKVQFQKQDQDSCEKNSEDKQVNFSEEFKSISQKQVQQEEDKQNILKEIQDNLEKKSGGSSPESIAQKSIKEKDSERPQSGLKKKKKHDKCEKISKGSKPENKALKPIKRKKAEASLTGLIEEVVPVKKVQFQKQDQDSCEKNSEDKRVNFSEELKSISQKQIQQEEDKQNILKEVQDNFEKKSRGFEPETIAQNSIKEKDTDRSQSGLKKKKKHDRCEKISKGSKSDNKALKSIKRKTEEASLTKLIEEVVPVKQVLFEKQNQDNCEKKSEDKRDNFKENVKKAKFENIEQEPIQQSINDQKKNSLTLQDIIQNQNKENKNHNMLKENQDTYVKISKGSKPGNTNLKSIEKIVPVKQIMIQKRDQDNDENKSKEKHENITQKLINKITNGKQEEVQPSESGLIGRIVLIKPVAICKEINCETNLKPSKPENTTLNQNCVNNIRPEESFKAQISKNPQNRVHDDQSKQINCSEKSIKKSAQKLNQQVNNTQEMGVETSKSGLIGRIPPVMQVAIDEEENKRDSCTKNSKRKREPIEMQEVQLENKVQKVTSAESKLKKLKMSNLVKPTQLVAPEKVTICQSDTRITNRNCENNISPLHQENSEQNQLHASMDEMLNERWRKMKANVEKSENKIRSQFMRCNEYILANEGTEELTEEPMQTKKAEEISQTSLIGKLKSLLKRRLTCHF